MNKQLRQYFKVGVTLVISMVALFFALAYLRGKLNSDKQIKVVFDDARGIGRGETVEMAGVSVGQVDDVQLRPEDNKAVLTVGVRKTVRIPKGSQFQIRSGLLGNLSTLVIVPSRDPSATVLQEGDEVIGDSSAPFDETLAESKKLMVEGRKLVATLQKTVGDPERQRALDATIRNTEQITEDLKQVTAQLPAVKRQLDLMIVDLRNTLGSTKQIASGAEGLTQDARTLARQAQGVAADARKLTRDLDATVNENRATLKSLLESADEAASAVAGLTDQVRTTLADSKLKENLQAATNNLVSISTRLDNVAGNLEKLAGDPKLNSDIRETVTNLRETSVSMRNLTSRLETIRIPGERRPPSTGASTTSARPFSATSLLEPGFVFDSLYDTTLGRLRVDTNYTLLSGERNFYRIGLYDATESNQLNLQYGWSDGRPARFDYRAGVINGKFGLGFDARTGPLDLRVDFFDPNRFRVNVRAKATLNKNAAITAGVDEIGKENRATLGVQIRQ